METFQSSEEVLDQPGFEREELCEISDPVRSWAGCSRTSPKSLGVPAGIPIVGGAGDGQTAGLVANVTTSERAYLNLGTAVVSGTYSDDYAWGREFRTLGGPLPRTYTLETLLQGGPRSGPRNDWDVHGFANRTVYSVAPACGPGSRVLLG